MKHDPEREAKNNEIIKSCETKKVLSSTDDDSFDEIKEDLPSNENDSPLKNEDWTEYLCEQCEYTTNNNQNLKCHAKSKHESIETEQANSKKRKFANDTLTSNESLIKVSKINGDKAIRREQHNSM